MVTGLPSSNPSTSRPSSGRHFRSGSWGGAAEVSTTRSRGPCGPCTPTVTSGVRARNASQWSSRNAHHNTAASIDRAEQSRTAKAMGQKGDAPKLPKGDAGRKGLTDASATSKWRWPGTGDQAERAKQDWTRQKPAGRNSEQQGRALLDKQRPTPPAEKDRADRA